MKRMAYRTRVMLMLFVMLTGVIPTGGGMVSAETEKTSDLLFNGF